MKKLLLLISLFALSLGLSTGACGHAPRGESSGKPSAAPKKPPPSGPLDERQLRVAMDTVRPQLLGCCPLMPNARPGRDAWPADSVAEAWCAIGLEISSDGEVTRSTASGSHGLTQELDCMENVARLAHFPASTNPSTFATYWVRCDQTWR